MALHIDLVTLVVAEYEPAIAFYTRAVGFDLIEDLDLGGGKRWVVVGPARGTRLLLARAVDAAQRAAIGHQTGGRVGFFLETDDFAAEHARMAAAGVMFEEPPRHEPYGVVAVWRDPFGNRWDLIERA
ncbi:MAG: VOC family protein [Pseudomonadota bacterium]